MNQLENLLNQRQYLLSELELFQHPTITLIILVIAIMAIIWVFYRSWHRYCYTITGGSILLFTILAISIVIYIYMDIHIEYRNLCQELTLVEQELVRDFNYKLP
jgi:hypothetical protein